jgi:hypothetical protein
MSDAIIWKMPGTNDDAMRSQTAQRGLPWIGSSSAGAPVHARAIGDLLHARAVDAAPNEDLVGGVEDAGLEYPLQFAQTV